MPNKYLLHEQAQKDYKTSLKWYGKEANWWRRIL